MSIYSWIKNLNKYNFFFLQNFVIYFPLLSPKISNRGGICILKACTAYEGCYSLWSPVNEYHNIKNIANITLSNLLNGGLWFYIVFKAIGNKKDETLLTKNTEEKQNSVTVIPLDGKGTVFPVKLKLEEKSFE